MVNASMAIRRHFSSAAVPNLPRASAYLPSLCGVCAFSADQLRLFELGASPCSRAFSAVVLRNQHIYRGDDEQREQGADAHATDQHDADRVTSHSARASDQSEWKVTSHSGHG